MARARPPERPASGAAGSSWACSLRGAPRPPTPGQAERVFGLEMQRTQGWPVAVFGSGLPTVARAFTIRRPFVNSGPFRSRSKFSVPFESLMRNNQPEPHAVVTRPSGASCLRSPQPHPSLISGLANWNPWAKLY